MVRVLGQQVLADLGGRLELARTDGALERAGSRLVEQVLRLLDSLTVVKLSMQLFVLLEGLSRAGLEA